MKFKNFFLAVMFCLAASLVAAESNILVVTADSCNGVISHVPDAGVEYQPEQNAEFPADMNAQKIELPQEVIIPIEFATTTAHPDLEQKADLDKLSYDLKTGRLRYNGKDLSQQSEADIIAACRSLKR